MKVPTLTGTNFEEFDLAFTSAVRRQNYLIGITLYYLLRPYVVGNYNAAYNYREEKLKFCANLQGQAFNDDTETLYNLLVQYVSTYETASSTVYRHTRSNTVHKCYLEIQGNLKTEYYEEKKASKANAILQSVHYDGNRNSTLEHYYNLVVKSFFQLEEAGPVYTLTEAQNINLFENGLNDSTAIKFPITEKRKWNKILENQHTFDTYYNSM